MGKRGPQPTPTKVLKARGSWRGKTRHGEPEASGLPEPPGWLGEDARGIWNDAVERLTNMGVGRRIDSNAIARYATLLHRWVQCEQFIAKNGTTIPVKDDAGRVVGVKELPHVGRASRLADQLLKLEREFGMTPSARAALATDTGRSKEPDGIAGFINPKLVG